MQSQYTVPLEPEGYYHIYNRGNNGDTVFFSDDNYRYFLEKLDDYFADLLVLHAFCLLRNHFHLLAEVNPEGKIRQSIIDNAKYVKLRKYLNEPIEKILSKQFQYFFISYAKSINKKIGRHGSLFEKPFRRKQITTDEYYRNAIYYIHRNMIHHGFDIDFRDYPWSSYSRILETKSSKLPKEQIIKAFDNRENYIYFHNKNRDLDNISEYLIDY